MLRARGLLRCALGIRRFDYEIIPPLMCRHRHSSPPHLNELPTASSTVQEDLRQAVTFLDHNSSLTEDDEWSSSPYPKARYVSETDNEDTALIKPDDTSVLLFPGQGTQFVGMGKELLEYPSVKGMFASASDILGFDLLQLCLNGPEEELAKTRNQQPAILVCSLAALQKLMILNPKAVEQCVYTAGFSAGEIAALVFAGSLSFEAAVQLIKVRANAMQDASEQRSSGLLRILEDRRTSVGKMCDEAVEAAKDSLGDLTPICKTTHFLFPSCRVVGGDTAALEYIEANCAKFFLRARDVRRLPVSGAFHTLLMKEAVEPVWEAMSMMPVKDPLIPVFANCDAKPMTTARQVRRNLVRQLNSSVKWQQIMAQIYTRPSGKAFPSTFEVGPGAQLGTILNRSNVKAFRHYTAVSV